MSVLVYESVHITEDVPLFCRQCFDGFIFKSTNIADLFKTVHILQSMPPGMEVEYLYTRMDI